MSIFNKQSRIEKKVFVELEKKIKNANPLYHHIDVNKEVYELPGGVWVSFDVITNDLEVTCGGNKIFELNCKYDSWDEMQQIRYNRFDSLLRYSRKRLESEKAKTKRIKLKKAETAVKAKKQKDFEQVYTQKALEQIKQL